MSKQRKCEICGNKFNENELFPIEAIRESLVSFIMQKHPDLDEDGFICTDDLDHQGLSYTENMLTQELGELDNLEKEVLESFATKDILVENVNEEYEESLTFGERMSDRVSDFGGSWKFIGLFAAVLIIWMIINTIILMSQAFDPYPYILLNLVLSCLAAVQAPIIMMSQNRKSIRDRLQAENDYKVNLKAELQIRNLNSKIDHLMKNQWLHMLETQASQIKLQKKILDKVDNPNYTKN